jgi:hypothetical protein
MPHRRRLNHAFILAIARARFREGFAELSIDDSLGEQIR